MLYHFMTELSSKKLHFAALQLQSSKSLQDKLQPLGVTLEVSMSTQAQLRRIGGCFVFYMFYPLVG